VCLVSTDDYTLLFLFSFYLFLFSFDILSSAARLSLYFDDALILFTVFDRIIWRC
jgi:hypothetical protein